MSIIWTLIIGFVAGVIAKFIMPGDNEPSGFRPRSSGSWGHSWRPILARLLAGTDLGKARG